MIKIICFGDSITLGEKDPQGGWADRLKRDYFKKFEANQNQLVSLYNLGIAGETSDGLAARFAHEVTARRIKGQQLVIIISCGINDLVIHKGKNLVPVNYFERNLTNCLQHAKHLATSILLCNILPISEKNNGQVNQYGKLIYSRDILIYNQAITRLANQLNCVYIDNHELFRANQPEKLLASDGLHPNCYGHELIYTNIQTKLAELIELND